MLSPAPRKERSLAMIQAGNRLSRQQLWGKGTGAMSWAGASSESWPHLGLLRQEHCQELRAGSVPSAQDLLLDNIWVL